MTHETRRLASRSFTLAVAACLMAACGSPSGGSPAQGTEEDRPSGGNGGTFAVDMSVRVVNLFIPDGVAEGSDIEVWYGSPGSGGKKLQTVAYGEASEFFAPEAEDQEGEGQQADNVFWTLGFFPAGATADDEPLGEQSLWSGPDQKATVVVSPVEPGAGAAGLSFFPDDIGSNPAQSSLSEPYIPGVPDGRAAFLISVAGVRYLDESTDSGEFVASDGDGGCLPVIDWETGELDDFSDGSASFLGSTILLPYALEPGDSAVLNGVGDSQTVEESCGGADVFGPIDPELGEGEQAYGFVYGTDPKSLKMLVLPIG